MKRIDRDTLRQPIALVSDGIESMPFSVPDIDVANMTDQVTDTVGELVTTLASGGSKTAFRTVKAIYRHRRAVGYGTLAIMLVAIGAVLAKKVASSDDSPATA